MVPRPSPSPILSSRAKSRDLNTLRRAPNPPSPYCHPERSRGACPERSPATQDGVERNLNTPRPAPKPPALLPSRRLSAVSRRAGPSCPAASPLVPSWFPGRRRPPSCHPERSRGISTPIAAHPTLRPYCPPADSPPFPVGQDPRVLPPPPSCLRGSPAVAAPQPVIPSAAEGPQHPSQTSLPHTKRAPHPLPGRSRPPPVIPSAAEGPQHPPPRAQPSVPILSSRAQPRDLNTPRPAPNPPALLPSRRSPFPGRTDARSVTWPLPFPAGTHHLPTASPSASHAARPPHSVIPTEAEGSVLTTNAFAPRRPSSAAGLTAPAVPVRFAASCNRAITWRLSWLCLGRSL